MKKQVVIGLLALVILFAVSFSSVNFAADKSPQPTSKIGTLSVKKIFQECKRNETYRQQAKTEQDAMIAEMDKLGKEIDAEEAGLKTLKEGTDDYFNSYKEVLNKKAMYDSKKEYYKRTFERKDLKWTESLYSDILKITAEVAAAKGLDAVMEVSEPELPAASPNELMLAIRTHKLIYSKGCVDITKEVMDKIDAAK